MTTRPPVPSKDAVRALRCLALSTPLIFAGATGGACCLAAVHYEIRRRINLAEKIVRTKRTIHSVSTGKGKAHVSKLLKAAENGDDFLLSSHKSLKRRQSRKFSAVAVQSDFPDQEMVEMLQASQAAPSRSPKHGNKSVDHSVAIPNETTSRAALGAKTTYNDQRMHIRSSKLSQVQSKMSDFTPITEPRIVPQDPSLRPTVTQPLDAEDVGHMGSISKRHAVIGDLNIRGLFKKSDQKQTDLNPCSPKTLVVGKTVNAASDSILLQSLASFSDSGECIDGDIVLNPPERGAAINNKAGHSSTQTTEAVLQSQVTNTSENMTEFPSLVPYVTIGHIPDYKRYPRPSFFAMRYSKYETLVQDAGFERYEYVYNHLMYAFDTFRGRRECLLFLERTLQKHMESRSREDFALVVLLVQEFRKYFRKELWTEMMQRFVKAQLQQSNTSTESVALLYLNSKIGKLTNNLSVYNYAQQYLERYCDKHNSAELQLEETVKILKGTVAAGFPVHDTLLTPLIRGLCVKGETAKAESFLKDVYNDFGFEPTFLTLVEIVRGHARNGDWTKIDYILSRQHEMEHSRGKFNGFAALLERALEEYAQRKSPERIYDFLTYYIQGFGLVPTSPISNIALDAFIRSKRYDLVRDWVRERQLHFPALSPATSTNGSTITIGNAWHDTRASTEEILHACTALAEINVRDPFSPMFRSVAMDAAFENISACVESLRRTLLEHKEVDKHQPAKDFRDLREEADKLIASLPSGKLQTIQQMLISETLVRQMKAAQQLHSLLKGDRFGQGHNELPLSPTDAPSSTKGGLSDTNDPDVLAILSEIPAELKKESFPSLVRVEELLEQFYVNRGKQGLRPDHNILRYVATKMTRNQREREALSIMETVHQSHWAQGRNGTPFDIEVFGTWLDLICQLRHPRKFMEVLWALLDSDVKLKITTRFFILVRHTQHKILDPRLRHLSPAQEQECNYLVQRFKRRASEEGCRYYDEITVEHMESQYLGR